ncbi:MAG TPA: hypothetical protein VIY27_13025 [Myxococcota bacterium]
MDLIPYTQDLITGLIYVLLGARLWRLSQRTNRLPERLLGTSLLLWGGNYFLYDGSYLALGEPAAAPFYFAARLVLDLGVFVLALFTWKVFRSEDTWGALLVAGIGACILIGVGGSIWIQEWEGLLPISNPWFWPAWIAGVVSYAWMTAESFYHHRWSLQRQRLDLCDAMACERFLLWSLAGAIWFVQEWIIIYQYVEYEALQRWGVAMNFFVSSLEIIPAVLMGLAFTPPAFYRAWVRRRYAPS